MNSLFRHVVFLLWVSGALGTTESTTSTTTSHGDTTTAITSTDSPAGYTSTSGITGLSSASGNGTCPSRTVNYITNTLPRQCLRTDRVPHNTTTSTSVSESEVPPTSITSTVSVGSDPASPAASDLTEGLQATSSTEILTSASQDDTVPASVTSTVIAESAIEVATEEDSESPLDNANFLSFEDWKKQNLAKTGQSPEDIGRAQPVNPNRPRPGINNALDTLGEESEIDLDFTGFGGAKPALPEGHQERASLNSDTSVGHHEGGSVLRSKDAGKTCKERTNYASFDCSATILKSNKECKSASSVLVESKDSYMLNTCSAQNKFFIVQLCNDIQIDTIVLANYEFFSSGFRHFRVSVSDRYPVEMDKWKDLGTFEARNTREIQAFLVENPIIWAKYLRIEFLSHYGTEYYCPVSLLRVHGTTMIEDYRHQEYIAQGEVEDVTLEAEVLATPAVVPVTVETIVDISTSPALEEPKPTEPTSVPAEQQETATPIAESAPTYDPATSTNASVVLVDESGAPMQVGSYEPSNANLTCETRDTDESPTETVSLSDDAPSSPGATQVAKTTQTETANESTTAVVSPEPTPESSAATSQIQEPQVILTSESAQSTASSTTNSTTAAPGTAPANVTSANVALSQALPSVNSTRTAVNPPPAQPSTQESFFKSFAKRLSQLESNSTLSLQYIEEQSRILREAFSKVEKRQVGTTTKFLSQLNETVMVELHGFRQAYDQLWQSTVIELDGQRESYQREMLAMSSRLTMVADELVWQKRMGIVQSTLLLLCLALVLFGGRGGSSYLEVPLMQQMINRSKRWEYSEPNSPSPDSRSPVSLFRRKIWRTKSEPANETPNLTDSELSPPQSQAGPDVVIEPPSPPRNETPQNEHEEEQDSTDVEKREEVPEERKVNGHKRNRSRKKKRPPNWPQGNGGVGVSAMGERAKSPLAM